MVVPRAPCDTTEPCRARRVYKATEPWGAHWQESHSPSTQQVLYPSAAEMDEDKQNPKSRSPSPWPSWLEDEALSGQWEGAVGGSDLPLSQSEEGAFLYMHEDWKYDTDQELSQCGDVTSWEEDGTLQELCYWEEEVRVQKHPQCRARRRQELYEVAEDVRVREHSQWCDGRHPELYQLEERVRVQELHQWEEDGVRYQELTQWEEHVTVQEVSQWRDHTSYNSQVNPLCLVNVEEPQTCPQQGSSSPSPVGTEGTGQAACDLPSVAPAPLSPMDTEPAADAPTGAAEEKEPLTPEEEKAEGSPTFKEQVPPAGRDSDALAPHSPSEASQDLLDTNQHICSEVLSQAELDIQGSNQQPQAERELGPTVTVEMEGTATGERAESPVPAPHSPCCLCCPVYIYMEAQALSGQQTEGAGGSVLASQGTEEGAFAEDENDWKFYDELDICKWQWQREGIGYQGVFEGEGDLGSESSEEEVERASMPSRWEGDSDRELALEDCEQVTVPNTEVMPLGPEEDEWEELSVLELSQGEGRAEGARLAVPEGLPVPAPRQAWAERQAPAPSTAVPLCACPAQLEAQSPRGAAASPAFHEQGAGAGTRSQGPAPQSPCRPPSPSRPQPALPHSRPSRARRALQALHSLFRSCLGGQPQD